jgi:hypothetical protein
VALPLGILTFATDDVPKTIGPPRPEHEPIAASDELDGLISPSKILIVPTVDVPPSNTKADRPKML